MYNDFIVENELLSISCVLKAVATRKISLLTSDIKPGIVRREIMKQALKSSI